MGNQNLRAQPHSPDFQELTLLVRGDSSCAPGKHFLEDKSSLNQQLLPLEWCASAWCSQCTTFPELGWVGAAASRHEAQLLWRAGGTRGEAESLACTLCYLKGRRSLHLQDLKEQDDSCRHMETAAKVEKSRDFVRHLEALKE